MTAERKTFVDTGVFFAFVDRDESHHKDVISLFREAERKGMIVLTSNFIVAETHALILSRLSRSLAAKWLESILSYAKVERVRRADEEKAREIIFHYSDKHFSYTDATSFALMERLKNKESVLPGCSFCSIWAV